MKHKVVSIITGSLNNNSPIYSYNRHVLDKIQNNPHIEFRRIFTAIVRLRSRQTPEVVIDESRVHEKPHRVPEIFHGQQPTDWIFVFFESIY